MSVVDVTEPPEVGTVFRANSLAQARFMRSTAPELLISSAYGKGKSRALCEKAHWLCCGYPRAKVILARKMRAHIGGTTLKTLLDEVVHPSFIRWGWRPAADGGSTLFYPNGSELIIVGLDNPGRARSGAYTAAFVDQCEELEEDEWDAIAGRMRWMVGPYRQLAGACNPDSPEHFLFRRFRPDLGSHQTVTSHDETLLDGRVLPAGSVRAEVIVSGKGDNYTNLPADYIARLSRMTGRYRQRYVMGEWVYFEGQVYDAWDDSAMHVTRPEEWDRLWGGYPPITWPRFRAIDFGTVNPFVYQSWTRDPEGRWWLYRELYHTHRTTPDMRDWGLRLEREELATLNACAARLDPRHEPLRWLPMNLTATDHDAGDRMLLEETGDIASVPAIKDIEAGVQTVYEAMENDRLRIVRGALVQPDPELERAGLPTCTVMEVPALRYPRARRDMSQHSPNEAPIKKNDHGCDAMRYLLHTSRRLGDASLIRLSDQPISSRESLLRKLYED